MLTGFDCQTCSYANLAGLKNGALLSAAESAGFDVLVTIDQQIPYQQNISNRHIAIIVIRARSNRLADLKLLLPAIVEALESIESGRILVVT